MSPVYHFVQPALFPSMRFCFVCGKTSIPRQRILYCSWKCYQEGHVPGNTGRKGGHINHSEEWYEKRRTFVPPNKGIGAKYNPCEVCGEPVGTAGKRFCSKKCYREGIVAWNKGTKATPEMRKKLSEAHKDLPLTPAQIEHLKNIRKNDYVFKPSKTEQRVQSILDELGISYKPQAYILKRPVDFLLLDQRTIIEVYGCYWHACPDCNLPRPSRRHVPENKYQLDYERREALTQKGYKVVVIWEHDIKNNLDTARSLAMGFCAYQNPHLLKSTTI